MINSIDFYFDFISPYSYLAYQKIRIIRNDHTIHSWKDAQSFRKYDMTRHKEKLHPAFYVAYFYNQTYDPSYKIAGDS